MSASRRRLLIIALAAAVVGAALYTALWMQGARILERAIAAWADDQRAAGIDVSYSRVETRGYPFILRGVVHDAVIAQDDAWRWSAARLFVDAAPWAPDRLAFSPGAQVIDVAEFGRWTIESASGRAIIAIDRTSGWRLRIKSGAGSIANESGSLVLRSGRFDALITPEGARRNDVRATILVAGLETTGRTGQPVKADLLEFDFEVADPEAGGPRQFTIHRFALAGEGGRAEVSGAFTIDAAGFPEGELYADIANPGVIAGALGELGALSAQDAQAAAAVLSLAAIAGGGRIAGPLFFHKGKASIAGVAVANLPKID